MKITLKIDGVETDFEQVEPVVVEAATETVPEVAEVVTDTPETTEATEEVTA